MVIKPTYSEAHPFKNGRAAVKNDKGEDIYINKSGQFVDYTEGQKRQQRAEQARKDSIAAAQERERLAAERRAAEERRQAEAKEADLQKRINANKDPKKWHRGDRMCYRFGTSNDFVLATLEEWNSDRSKIKVKIVASPSNLMKLNGESLTKNNTMWVSVRGEGWHLALDEEVKIATQNDRSDDDHICSACNGRGTVPCSRCNGTGVYEYTSTFLWTSSTERERCTRCNGKGSTSCYSCGGSGRR